MVSLTRMSESMGRDRLHWLEHSSNSTTSNSVLQTSESVVKKQAHVSSFCLERASQGCFTTLCILVKQS